MARYLVVPCILATLLTAPDASFGGLIAFYDFEGNANDVSGNGLHGVVNGDVVLTASGFQGSAYEFGGTTGQNLSNFIQLPFGINPSTYPELTMGAWVNTDIVGGSSGAIAPKVIGYDNGGFDRALGADFRSGAATIVPSNWSAFAGNQGVLSSGQPVTTGNWVFLAAVYDQPNATVKLYVDNTIATVSSASLGSSPLNATIGKNAGFGSNEAWDGRIDNVFFFDEALTTSQIEAIRTNPDSLNPVPEPSSIALFAMGGLTLLGYGWRRRKAFGR
jgi:Concanavalin A-like lectin/glucanases superfamily/PEP-CTERM motif